MTTYDIEELAYRAMGKTDEETDALLEDGD